MNPSRNDTNTSKPRLKINKFMVGGLILVIAVVVLIATSIEGSAQYYYTIDELVSGQGGRQTNLRVSGVVLGDTIAYDPATFELTFTIANIPGDNKEIEAAGGLAQVLHNASLDETAARLVVVYSGERPDLLTNEAQAIVTGSLGEDGRFYAEELLLKCPSRYEDSIPNQAAP